MVISESLPCLPELQALEQTYVYKGIQSAHNSSTAGTEYLHIISYEMNKTQPLSSGELQTSRQINEHFLKLNYNSCH